MSTTLVIAHVLDGHITDVTLQAVAQVKAHPARASIIMSLEAAFAVLSGWLILGELMDARQLAGCAIMLAGMILAQLPGRSPASGSGGTP